MKKYLNLLIALLLVVSLPACGTKKENKKEEKKENKEQEASTDINIVTSLEDEIKGNTSWCGTFNLVWNELKDEFVKGDIVVNPSTTQIDNLNKSTFNKTYLNDNSYYIKFGKQVPELKKEIEENIKKKFDQKSDILDSFEWEENSTKDLIYTMLYKKFTFEIPFKQLENEKFNSNGDYRYFGINEGYRAGENQVNVLFYDDFNNYSVKIDTKEGEEVILLRTKENDSKSFLDYYNYLVNKTKEYEGEKNLKSLDELKVPYLNFSVYKEIEGVESIKFLYEDGSEHTINKAIQTIKLQLSESGGDIKSEAAISTETASPYEPEESRYFYFNDSFIIFLKEKDKELPFFGAYISDLSMFQKK